MKTIIGFFLALSLIMNLSCKDSIVDTSTPFSMRVIVKNPGGTLIPGIRVSCWNVLSKPIFPGAKTAPRIPHNSLYGTTSIVFSAPVAYRGQLEVFDLDGKRVADLLDGSMRPAGTYMVNWQTSEEISTGVYKYRFTALSDTTSSVLFRDSLYAVLYQYDPALTIVGWTGADGVVQTSKAVQFPHLYPLPHFIETELDPTPVDSFTVTDSVRIALSDTTNHLMMKYTRLVKSGSNEFILTWDPTLAEPLPPAEILHVPGHLRGIASDIEPIDVPHDWHLYQNYPNPFN